MLINTEADQKERHALVLCLFIAPDITISRMARGEGKSGAHSACERFYVVVWEATPMVMEFSDLV